MLAFQAFHLAAYQPPAATVASNLMPDTDAAPDGFSYRAVACPLQWLPVLLAGAPHVFETKVDLQIAVQAYNTNAASANATYDPIAGWDVSRITDMSWLFPPHPNFNADISSWDTSSVTTMSRMFYLVKAFNQPLSFDTSRVTDMNYMFAYASAFNQPLSFDTSNVASMTAMFRVRFAR